MLTRPIPSTGETLPVIGIGTWQTFDIGNGEQERTIRREVLATLYAAGGRMIDSSPMYGRAEGVVGDLVDAMGTRDRSFIATKVWTTGREAGLLQIETSHRLLKSPVIDLVQIHNLVDWRTHLKTLRVAKAEGRIRYIGITHYTVPALDELAAVLREESVDFVQTIYSLDVRDAESRLLPLAADRGVAVIANKPFAAGRMFDKVKGKPLPGWARDIGCASWAAVMLKYIVSHPALTCVIPATSRPARAAEFVAAGAGPVPDAAMRKTIATYWDSL